VGFRRWAAGVLCAVERGLEPRGFGGGDVEWAEVRL
jgi:hypothetical protein